MTANNPVHFFFFSSRRRHTRCLSDWSSDVCSSDSHQPPQRQSTRQRVPNEPVKSLKTHKPHGFVPISPIQTAIYPLPRRRFPGSRRRPRESNDLHDTQFKTQISVDFYDITVL